MAALAAHLVLDEQAAARRSNGPAPLTLFDSIGSLAGKLGVTANTAREHVHALVRVGVLVKVDTGAGGRRWFGKRLAGLATTYRFEPGALTLRKTSNAASPESLQEGGGLAPGALAEIGKVDAPYPPENPEGLIRDVELSASTGTIQAYRRRAAGATDSVTRPDALAVKRAIAFYQQA
jgi:hypothetical protein